jgi:hypothetical protein
MRPFILTCSIGNRHRSATCYSVAQAAGYLARFAASVGQSIHAITWNVKPLSAA